MSYYLFRVPPQKEQAAAEILRRRGYDAFCPTEKRFLRRSRSRKKPGEREYVVLHGYVPVRFDTQPPWFDLFRMTLIKSVIVFDGRPRAISEDQMRRFLQAIGSALPDRFNKRRSFIKGDAATYTGHGFTEFPVRIEEVSGPLAKILLPLLGAEREVSVRLEELEAA